MLEILSITGVIFILIGLGFASVKLGLFSAADVGTLGKYVVYFALPALIYRAIGSRQIEEIANPVYLVSYLAGAVIAFWFGYVWSRRMAGNGPMTSTFWAMGMACPNSGFVGYPVLLMALPGVASTALALNIVAENVVLIPMVLIMIEYARGKSTDRNLALQILGRLMRNPIVIAFLVGMVGMVLEIELPPVLARPIELIAGSSAAVSLVSIGGSLALVQVGRLDPALMMITFGKLILHPLAVAGVLFLFGLFGFGLADPELRAAVILSAAMPVMAIYPILAQQNGEGQTASVALLMMTVMAMATLSAALWVLTPT